MKVSRAWLQNFFDSPLPEARELADALTFHAFEIESVEGDVLDVKVTANRGHDCLSHRGIAKELSAILRMPLNPAKDPFARKPDLSKKTEAVSVSIENPTLCRRYVAGFIQGVKVAPSPAWLAQSLEALGQRSVNNVVDATNFVMFNTGQPLHAFDASRLEAEKGRFVLAVRNAAEGETMVALDDKEYQLSPSNLVIADANAGVPIGIAGVKGGKPAGITEVTTDIIIESANFDGVSVRKTASTLKLRTDASARFEQGIAPELAAYGMQQVVELIMEIAGGELVGIADEYPSPVVSAPVSVSVADVNDCLGTDVSAMRVEDVLVRLGLAFEKNNDTFTVTPPFERLDMVIPEDLIEEVGRIIGYDAVPDVALPPFPNAVAVNKNFYYAERIREFLASEGFSEVFTSVFADSGERQVLNKVGGERPFLRSSLLPGLTDALERNDRIKESVGLSRARLFEMGTVWRGGEEHFMLGIVAAPQKKQPKASVALDEALAALGASASGLDGDAVEISLPGIFEPLPAPAAYEELPLSRTERYAPYSKYPYIVRDVSFWAPGGTNAEETEALIRSAAGPLVQRIDLFDRFEKDEKVSFAYRLVLQSFDRTLTDDEANSVLAAVSGALSGRGFEIR